MISSTEEEQEEVRELIPLKEQSKKDPTLKLNNYYDIVFSGIVIMRSIVYNPSNILNEPFYD